MEECPVLFIIMFDGRQFLLPISRGNFTRLKQKFDFLGIMGIWEAKGRTYEERGSSFVSKFIYLQVTIYHK